MRASGGHTRLRVNEARATYMRLYVDVQNIWKMLAIIGAARHKTWRVFENFHLERDRNKDMLSVAGGSNATQRSNLEVSN